MWPLFLGLSLTASVVPCAAGSSLGEVEPFQPQPASLAHDHRSSWCAVNHSEQQPLAGRELAVVFLLGPGNVTVQTDATGRVVGGFLVHIMNDLATLGGFTWKGYVASRPPGKAFGPFIMALASKYDLVAAVIAITPKRRQLGMTFCWPIIDMTPVLVAPVHWESPSMFETFTRVFLPFDRKTWMAVLASFLFTAIAYMIIEWPGDDIKDYTARFFHALGQAMYLTVGSFTGGVGFAPTTRPGKCISIGWTYAMLLLTAAYTANLASLLVVERTRTSTIKSFEDAERRRIPICMEPGTLAEELTRKQYPAAVLRPGLFSLRNAGLQHMKEYKCGAAVLPKHAWALGRNNRKVNPSCNFDVVGHSPVSAQGSFGMLLEHNFCTYKLAHSLNIWMQTLYETGAIAKYYEDELEMLSQQDCADPAAGDGGSNGALTLQDTAGIFGIVVAVGLAALSWHYFDDGFHCHKNFADTVGRRTSGTSEEWSDTNDDKST